MSDNGETLNLVVETQETLPSFLEDKIDLRRLVREISRASGPAVDALVKLLESPDDRVRLQAATKLVEFQVQVAKEISSDQMQRLIAEIKLVRDGGQGGKKKLIPVEQPRRPLVDFGTIREV